MNDHQIREFVLTTVSEQVRSLGDQLRSEHREDKHKINDQLHRHSTQIELIVLENQKDREISTTKLDSVARVVNEIKSFIEGDDKGPMAVRMAMLEARVFELQAGSTQSKQWWQTICAQLAPVILTWIGGAIFYLAYTVLKL